MGGGKQTAVVLFLALHCLPVMAENRLFDRLCAGDSRETVGAALPEGSRVDLFGTEFSIHPCFEGDKLDSVLLFSKKGRYSDYRDHVLWPLYNTLRRAFIEKYGEPLLENDFETIRLQVPEGNDVTLCRWETPDKRVAIFLMEPRAADYLLCIQISDRISAEAAEKEEKERVKGLF